MDFPYSNQKMLNNNKHTLWLMPTVNSCIAMTKLLQSDDYFSKYEIINLSDRSVGSGVDAFDYLMEGITRANNTNKLGSIALTVNKLTIGVTVKEWSSVFVLKDLSSPEQYFQSVFRIQTPLVKNGVILKKEGYVYDFNIDRAAALLLRYAEESGKNEAYTKLQTAKLIVKYLPIFMNGDMSSPIAYEVFYELATLGDQSKIPLSRKITNLANTTHVADEETLAAMLNDPEINDIFKKIFAHSKFKDKKQGGYKAVEPDPEKGYETKVAKEGRDKGYNLGLADSNLYLDLDDEVVQKTFEEKIENYVIEHRPKTYNHNEVVWYTNGFKKGYELGVNVPIRKLQCGKEDGVKFANNEVKAQFGNNILFTKETRPKIYNFVNQYLNDINHIPEEYRGMLYKRWYCDSFKLGVKTTLAPKIPAGPNDTSIADCNNALRHILSRLIEFLFISVYRETTFNEIFKNADPDIFLEAVGIKKEDFEALNKYHIFEEKTLNNYIHEFFVNESIGENLDTNNPDINNQYRNSFGWFGFNKIEQEVKDYVNGSNAKSIQEEITSYSNEAEADTNADLDVEEAPQSEAVRDDNSLEDKIVSLLKSNPKGMSAKKIAKALSVSKKEVNKILYENKNKFTQDFLTWRLRGGEISV